MSFESLKLDSEMKGKVISLALAGQPNVGKSTIFNMLTGLNQHVGNWPGKTVECKTGSLEHLGRTFHLVDLPGTYSLTANSEEERITREFIIHEKPDVVIAIVNAAVLERNLYLITELLALHVPIVMGLNMMDVAEKEGFKIDPKVLETALGIPVIPVIAAKNQGLKELLDIAVKVAESPELLKPNLPEVRADHRLVLKEVWDLIHGKVKSPYQEDWIALKLLEGDSEVIGLIQKENSDVWPAIEKILLQHEDAVLDITGGRYEWIAHMVRAAVFRPKPGTIVLTDRLDRIATHPLWGFLLLLCVFAFVFWLTYVIANPLVDLLNNGVIGSFASWMNNLLGSAPLWISGLIVDGIIGGVGTVLTFLPILILFFAVLGILEDIGYLSRAAFVMDRFMHWMGLHGRSFMPLFLGFGCNVPAISGTRIIEEKRPRLLTILLVPFVPCTARLAVITFLTPAFFAEYAALVTWLLVGSNLITLLIVGILFDRVVFKGSQTPFIMEMPLYHIPNFRTIALYVWHNTYAFVKKAGGIIVVFSAILWALSWLPRGDLNSSVLAVFGRWLQPLGRLMGLGDWRLIVSLLSSFIAKENTIASLGILFRIEETGQSLIQNLAVTVTPAAGLAFLVMQMLFIPCVATVAAIKQETSSWKWTIFSVLLMLVISFTAGIFIYQLGFKLGFGL